MLGITILISIAIIYEAALKKTINTYKECNNLELQIQVANDAPMKMSELKRKNERLDVLLGTGGMYGDIQQSIMGVVTGYCNQNELTLEEFPTPASEKNNGITIETNVFTIEGGFNKLLDLVYLFEQKYKLGKIVSVIYKLKKENSSHASKLNAIIYLQNIKKQP